MGNTVIEFKNVSKIYKLFKSDRQRFKAIFSRKAGYKKKVAVNDLSFKIEKGEAVALFGKNGAGKSTILKMITGVAYPTTGEITVNGRVSALLELTAGFDPEFTGRENIYFRGQLFGMSNAEIKRMTTFTKTFAAETKQEEVKQEIKQEVKKPVIIAVNVPKAEQPKQTNNNPYNSDYAAMLAAQLSRLMNNYSVPF